MKPKVLLINTHEGPEPEFADALERVIIKLGHDYRRIQVAQAIETLEKVDPTHILLSGGGSARTVNYTLTDPKFRAEMIEKYAWLKDVDVPVMGVCLGHQIISAVFGGEISDIGHRISDNAHKLTIQKQLGMFKGIDELVQRASHGNYVSKVPEGFACLSEVGGIPYIIANLDRQVYGIQSHAEFDERLGPFLYGKFLSLDPYIRRDIKLLYAAIDEAHPFSSMEECAGCSHSCEAPQWMSWVLPGEEAVMESYGFEIKHKSGAGFFKINRCIVHDSETGCTIHNYRPLECRLSPLLIVETEGDLGNGLYWALDAKCPAIIGASKDTEGINRIKERLTAPLKKIEEHVTPTIESNLRDIGRAINRFADIKEGEDYILVRRFTDRT